MLNPAWTIKMGDPRMFEQQANIAQRDMFRDVFSQVNAAAKQMTRDIDKAVYFPGLFRDTKEVAA